MAAKGRLLHSDWDRYNTRHVVFQPARLTPQALEYGYWRAYRDFYSWRNIARGAWAKDGWHERVRHMAYAGGWKKCKPLWDLVIRVRRVTGMLPVLEVVLSSFGQRASNDPPERTEGTPIVAPASGSDAGEARL
jgi:hypothetical protein